MYFDHYRVVHSVHTLPTHIYVQTTCISHLMTPLSNRFDSVFRNGQDKCVWIWGASLWQTMAPLLLVPDISRHPFHLTVPHPSVWSGSLFTKVCRHILPEMVQAFWCWKRKWFGKLKWNNEMSTRNRTALNRWLVSTLLWRLIQRAKYYAKFTFQSYLNINVCWQCVYTATL